MELVEKRRVGSPKTTMVGLAERIERYRLQEKCAALLDVPPSLRATADEVIE